MTWPDACFWSCVVVFIGFPILSISIGGMILLFCEIFDKGEKVMPSVTRRFRFEAAHRLLGHEGKCQYLHGHSYCAEVTISRPGLCIKGMVIDFSDLNKTIGQWIKDNWDHNMLLNSKDPLCWLYPNNGKFRDLDVFAGKSPYLFTDSNPTAEIMAKELFNRSANLLKNTNVNIEQVTIWETENCSATWTTQ